MHKQSQQRINKSTSKQQYSGAKSSSKNSKKISKKKSLSTDPQRHLFTRKQTFKSTAEFESLKARNPFIKHSDALPELPVSQMPEDQLYPNFRTIVRQNTDKIITVRQNNAEPYSYTHQIYAMNSIDPELFGDGSAQLVVPSRLVLDGPGGLEALAYYDHSISLPRSVDPEIAELKAFSRTLLLDVPDLQTIPHSQWVTPDSGLRQMQMSKVPTTFHSNFLVTNTHNGYKSDLAMAQTLYEDHITYAETSTALKNIGFWGLEAGNADQTLAQHYILPGQLIATTSTKSLGYVAALGAVSHKVSAVEAAAIMSGQPVQSFQPSNPVVINLQGALAQWVSPQDVTSMIIQYLGETAFNSAHIGLQQPIAIELTDKGNQFSLDELATICSAVGSLPNISTITVPPNATTFKYLRDTNRGAYTQILKAYGAQLLEPDHRVKYKDTVNINLSQIIPQITVHSSSIHNNTTPSPSQATLGPPPMPGVTSNQLQALNSVSCPIDYLDAITGTNPSKRLNLAKLTHIDNIAHHPAIEIESFDEANGLQKLYGEGRNGTRGQQVLGNRYKYLNLSEDTAEKLTRAFENANPVKNNPLGRFLNNDEKKSNQNNPQISAHSSNNTSNLAPTQSPSETGPELPRKSLFSSSNDNKGPIPTELRKVDNNLVPPASTVALSAKAPSGVAMRPGAGHPQQRAAGQQQQGQYWPQSPNVILIRGGYNEMNKAIRVMIQCIAEGMKPRVGMACLQFDSLQAMELTKNDDSLVDADGIHFFDKCEDLGITILAPGSGHIDAIVSKVILKEVADITAQQQRQQGQPQVKSITGKHPQQQNNTSQVPKIEPTDLHPTILTTDIGLAINDGGLGHYTPNIFTSGHEHSAMMVFSGNLAYDPINSTISPQTGSHNPNHHSSFFILPSRGVEAEIDVETNKLKVKIPVGMDFQRSSVISPSETIPSATLQTEFSLPIRFDMPEQTYNSQYTESRPVKALPSFEKVEETLGASKYHKTIVTSTKILNEEEIEKQKNEKNEKRENNVENNIENGNGEKNNPNNRTSTDTKSSPTQQDGLSYEMHDNINLRLHPPTRLGYKKRVKNHKNEEAVMTKRFIELVNNTNQQQTIYPSQWWNNSDITNLPILCNANLPTSANDISGLNSALRLTPVQSYVAKEGLSSWVSNTLLPSPTSLTTSSPLNTISTVVDDPESVDMGAIFTDLISRRLQTTPRHLKTLFPFHLPHLQLRYGLSGLRSTHIGAQPQIGKPEFVAATQPTSVLTPNGINNSNNHAQNDQNGQNNPNNSNNTTNTTSSVGIALGIRLAQLKETLRASQWGGFLLPIVTRDTAGVGTAPNNDQDDGYWHNIAHSHTITTTSATTSQNPSGHNSPALKAVLRNHFAEETNLLWTTNSSGVERSEVKNGDKNNNDFKNKNNNFNNNNDNNDFKNNHDKNNEFISNIMPAVRTFLKLPTSQSHSPSTSNSSLTQGLVNQYSNTTMMHQSIQSIAWNYFAAGQKWVLVGDGSLPTKDLNTDKSDHVSDMDDQYRWDQRGFGFGTVEECDDAAKTLRLLGCQGVLTTKINANMMRALKSHGVMTLQFTEPHDYNRFSINDTVSFMTHYTPPEEEEGEKEGENNKNSNDNGNNNDVTINNTNSSLQKKKKSPPQRTELFLPHQGPMVILHSNGNFVTSGQGHKAATLRNNGQVLSSVEIPVKNHYNPHSLVWFRAGNAANAGVELQLRKALVDKAIRYNTHTPELH